ncbi:MAG: hypothetical protein JW854_12715 [Actinobacteria bacterium]|nr:hypothetical protein [Actinomycetota bacterium]
MKHTEETAGEENVTESVAEDKEPGSTGGRIRTVIADISTDIFTAALALFCFLLIGEGFKPGFVYYFYNFYVIAAGVLFIGILAVLATRTSGQ